MSYEAMALNSAQTAILRELHVQASWKMSSMGKNIKIARDNSGGNFVIVGGATIGAFCERTICFGRAEKACLVGNLCRQRDLKGPAMVRLGINSSDRWHFLSI